MAKVVLARDNRPAVCSEFPFQVERVRRCVATAGERVQHSGRFGGREVRAYELSWDRATYGQADQIRRAFQSAGRVKAMDFRPPDSDGGLVEVVFVGDTLEMTRASANHYRIRFSVREVIR